MKRRGSWVSSYINNSLNSDPLCNDTGILNLDAIAVLNRYGDKTFILLNEQPAYGIDTKKIIEHISAQL